MVLTQRPFGDARAAIDKEKNKYIAVDSYDLKMHTHAYIIVLCHMV